MLGRVRAACGSVLVRRAPLCHGRAALCSLPPARIPEAESLSPDEFHRTVAGGASAFAIGELGASAEEMREFWMSRSVTDGALLHELSQRAANVGGVWGDPPTLGDRLAALEGLVPLRPAQLERLLRDAPHALAMRPQTVRAKVEALSRALPRVDVLEMVARRPSLLRRSPTHLARRAAAATAVMARSDMQEVVGRMPHLIEISAAELGARARALHSSYVPETMATWSTDRAAELLGTPASRLQRLRVLEGLNPGLRAALPDRYVLQMSENRWQLHFVQKKLSRWRGGRAVRPPPVSRDASPFNGAAVPRSGNALAWGRAQVRGGPTTLELRRN
jgi:hypothetical protein